MAETLTQADYRAIARILYAVHQRSADHEAGMHTDQPLERCADCRAEGKEAGEA